MNTRCTDTAGPVVSRPTNAPKFTPGPWATHPDQPTQVMDCADESFIADCEGLEPGGCPSDEANARLIAAAPELYGALEPLVHAVEAAHWPFTAEQMEPLNTARAALAKAVQS